MKGGINTILIQTYEIDLMAIHSVRISQRQIKID